MNERAEAPEVGLTVVHRRYVSYAQAHYAGNLVDGAWGLGLFASYSDVQFLAPVRAGDLVEASATLVRVGSRSRDLDFALVVLARGEGDSTAAARILPEPIVATTATGTVVVPHSE